MTTTTTTPSVLPASAPAGGNQVVVVDVPPPGWGQWENLPAPAPEPPVGVLVMKEDGCVMSGRPTHDAVASSSRGALRTTTHQEQGQERVSAPSAHFSEA
jgi:hypothetical protein